MPYYPQSAYYPLPSAPQAAALPPQPQQQYAGQPQQVYLQQQQQQLAYQQQAQLQQQQLIEQQNRQRAQQQQQYYQQQQLQQQQYAAQQLRLQQQQQYAQQQQYQQAAAPARQQQQRSGYQAAPLSPAAPQYKSSEYVQPGGGYSTGGALNQPLRRAASRADVNTAIENQEAPYQSFGQGLGSEQRVSQYNPYATYGQTVPQSPIRELRSQREPSEYAYDGLNPIYRQQAQQQQQYAAQGIPSELGARGLAAPTTVVLDSNNNVGAAPLPPRSPARGYGAQKGYASGQQAESAYISIPNDLVYAQNNQQRAYTYAQEARPAYASSSRTNQTQATPQLKPAAARELYAALSSENVRTALERDAPILVPANAYSTYNGQKVQGRAFVIPADQKYSEYNIEDLNGLRSCIDR